MANSTSNQNVMNVLSNVFALFPSYNAIVTQLNSQANELFKVTTVNSNLQDIYILAKELTPGGGANSSSRSQNEYRVQIYASNNNIICDKITNGDIGIILGVCKYNNQTILAAFKAVYSNGNGTISKQITIDTIEEASKSGFCKQDKRSGDYVYCFKQDFLFYYLKNLTSISHHKPQPVQLPPDILAIPRNLIYFGAPGTGKSFLLNEKAKELCPNGEYERVTFHPDYSYAQFVGTYKPIKVKNQNASSANGQPDDYISYEFVPGPFLRVLVNAMNNDGVPHLLIVEEINRANVAAVFGDIFQLLDRESDGTSTFPINMSEDMKAFLKDKVENFNSDTLSLPSNMYIWATMNSADQGVFPMDTAFKRRWDFMYVGIDDGESVIDNYSFDINGKFINWNELRKAINSLLLKLKLNEDKLMGPFFISLNTLNAGAKSFIEAFKSKVLMYLFEDAARHKRAEIFTPNSKGELLYSELCKRFDYFDVDILKGLEYHPVRLTNAVVDNNDGNSGNGDSV